MRTDRMPRRGPYCVPSPMSRFTLTLSHKASWHMKTLRIEPYTHFDRVMLQMGLLRTGLHPAASCTAALDTRMDRWMDGRMDRWMNRCIDG